MLNQLSFRAKQIILGIVNLILIGGLAMIAYQGMTDLSRMMKEQQATATLLRAQMTVDMKHDSAKSNVLYALTVGSEKEVDADARTRALRRFQDDRKALTDSIAVLDKTLVAGKSHDVLERVKPEIDSYLALADKMVSAAFRDHGAAKAQLPEFLKTFNELEKSLEKLGDAVEENITATADRGDAVSISALQQVVVAAVVGMLVLIGASALTIRSLIRSTNQAYGYLQDMLVGNLSADIRMDSRDEISKILLAVSQLRGKLTADLEDSRRTANELETLVRQTQKSIMEVGNSVTEIAATSKEQEATAVEVAATATEVSATSKEISATSRELVKTMGEVSTMAEHSASLAGSGQAGLAHMEETMRQVTEAAGTINAKLSVLNEKAGNISQVTTTITKVADQTNLLSLNAAIEAEKAGEYGRGFAIVATEIRRLADQTAVASYDIELMVKEIQSAVSASVMGMDKFSEEVRRGIHDVQQVSSSLSQVIDQVQALSPRFEGVNEGMQAQAQGAEQITDALAQLSEASQQTAEALRQTAQAVANVNQTMHDLSDSVSHYHLK